MKKNNYHKSVISIYLHQSEFFLAGFFIVTLERLPQFLYHPAGLS